MTTHLWKRLEAALAVHLLTGEENRIMKKMLPAVVALAIALVSMLPGIAAARIGLNHNQTTLGD